MKKIASFTFIICLLLGAEIKAQTKLEASIGPDKKIYMLSEIWKEVSYNFCDPQRLHEIKWDSLYRSNINDALNTKNDYEFYLLLKRFLASISDGHTMLEMENFIRSQSLGALPVLIQDVGKKYYLFGYLPEYVKNIPLGTEIEKINSIGIQDYLEKFVFPYAHSSTPQAKTKYALGVSISSGIIGDSINVQFKFSDGRSLPVWLKYVPGDKFNPSTRVILPSFRPKSSYQIKDSILYLGTTEFMGNSILNYVMKNKDQISKTKGVIIDLRENEGGSEEKADSLLMLFLNNTSIKTYQSLTRKHIAFNAAMGYGYPSFKPYYNNEVMDTLKESVFTKGDLPTFSQPLVVLVGPNTCSAAEDFLLALKINAPKRATIIGTPTSGSTGAPLVRFIDKKVYYKICTRKPLVDPLLFKNGIQPDVFYEKTIDEYLENSDKIIKIATAIINKKK